MAIAIDTNSASMSKSASGATSLTIAYTSSGSNRYTLLFGLDVDSTDTTPPALTAAYDGAAMAFIGQASRGPSNLNSLNGYIFGKSAPNTGSVNAVITRSAGGANWIEGGLISLTGALQSDTPDASTFTQGPAAGTSKSGTVTTVTDNCAVLYCICNDNGGLGSFSGATNVFSGNGSGFGTAIQVCKQSTFPFTPAGAATFSWNQNGTGSWFFLGVAIAPAEGASFTPTPMLHMLQMAGGIV